METKLSVAKTKTVIEFICFLISTSFMFCLQVTLKAHTILDLRILQDKLTVTEMN